jgi:nicotinamide-nucleotide amidase
MTSVPGSSRVFLGGVIAYANQVKERQLFVSEQTLIDHGAVSSQTATAMAENVRLLMGADLGVSVTGIAGPGGGTAQKPVGLVYAGLSTGAGTHAKKFEFTGHDRDSVRALTISAALDLLRDGLINPEP